MWAVNLSLDAMTSPKVPVPGAHLGDYLPLSMGFGEEREWHVTL